MADTPGIPFEQVWNELKENDTTGVFEQAEKLSLVTVESLEFAYNNGYKQGQADALAQVNKKKIAFWINPTTNPEFINKEFFSECSKCGHVVSFGEEPAECPQCKSLMSTEDPASVNPESEWKDIYGDGNVHCTNCKAIIEKDEPDRNYYFCYHCGRKMKNGTNPFGR